MKTFLRILFIYCLFDFFIGGISGGFLSMTPMLAAQQGPANSQQVDSAPAVSTQASASIAAQDNVRYVADQICFSAGSTTAPALTQLNVVLRDGATGAGTVLATFVVIIPAATGQNVAPYCAPMSVGGSNKTAMTAEWSALLTNLFEQVTLYYHKRPN